MSARVKGPMGWPAPRRIATSVSSMVASPAFHFLSEREEGRREGKCVCTFEFVSGVK